LASDKAREEQPVEQALVVHHLMGSTRTDPLLPAVKLAAAIAC
jgi:hypothetical protein